MEAGKRTLDDSERFDWLRLSRSENVGSLTFARLIDHFGSAAAALDGAPEMSRRGGRKRAIRIADSGGIDAEIATLSNLGARLIALCEPDYPAALAEIADPPPLISMIGDPTLPTKRAIAMVGARNASAAGCGLAREFAAALGEAGLVVVSGLARGIDTAAHEGALASGTVAVLAGGVDVIYPPENDELYGRIAAGGAVVSEIAPGTTPTARHFPPRNRLISGLSLGVLVVEAAPRSGSLITARMALEQGREVFAVPGSPRDPRARGGNELIRQGAVLTETPADILEVLDGPFQHRPGSPSGWEFGVEMEAPPAEGEIEAAHHTITEKLGAAPVTVDELVRECQLSARLVQTVLLELELAGRVERHPGNKISRAL